MSAAKPPDPNRPLARLVDGPYAGAVLYEESLRANQVASRRYPPGHPAADFSRYRRVQPEEAHDDLVAVAKDSDWAWEPLSAAERARLNPPESWTRDADLSSSAATGKATRDHEEWAAERRAERELRDAGHVIGTGGGW